MILCTHTNNGKNPNSSSFNRKWLQRQLLISTPIHTVFAWASRKSPFSIARIMSHLVMSMARCAFNLPSSSWNVTSVNACDPMNFSRFFLRYCVRGERMEWRQFDQFSLFGLLSFDNLYTNCSSYQGVATKMIILGERLFDGGRDSFAQIWDFQEIGCLLNLLKWSEQLYWVCDPFTSVCTGVWGRQLNCPIRDDGQRLQLVHSYLLLVLIELREEHIELTCSASVTHVKCRYLESTDFASRSFDRRACLRNRDEKAHHMAAPLKRFNVFSYRNTNLL